MSSQIVVVILAALVVILMPLIVPPPLSYSTTISDPDQTQAEAAEEKVSILANELETRINKSGAILEITSRLPQVSSVPFVDSISPELHGIPRDVDMPKRKVAQDILDIDKDFQLVYFLMPNGDVYFEEPYSRQENLTRNNLAFRDYFKRVLETGDTYLSDVVISASLGRPEANIAVPIYSQENNNATLVGVWAGGLNLTRLSNTLQSLNLTSDGGDDERIVYLDGKGQKVADSDSNSQLLSNATTQNESFANLQAFKNAIINGQSSGSTTEIVNGTMMLVSYHPVKAFSNSWVVLFMQPYEDGGSNSDNNAAG